MIFLWLTGLALKRAVATGSLASPDHPPRLCYTVLIVRATLSACLRRGVEVSGELGVRRVQTKLCLADL